MTTFSVITVVRNDPVGVTRTLQSVFRQSWTDYELIVQDGASTDETSDLLRRFAPWIDSLTIEKDGGIYNAMNRALERATGDWLLFLNAADFFANDTVLETVAGKIDPENDDIFVGQAIRDEDGKVHRFRPPDKFWAGSTCDHQSSFIRRNLIQEMRYNEEYRICGDLDFFTRARIQGARFRYEELPIARRPFSVGASSDFLDRIKDRFGMLENSFSHEYPVRDLITKELRLDTAQTCGLDVEDLKKFSLEDLLEMRSHWGAALENL